VTCCDSCFGDAGESPCGGHRTPATTTAARSARRSAAEGLHARASPWATRRRLDPGARDGHSRSAGFRRFAAKLHEITAGIPFVAEETVRALGAVAGAFPVGKTLPDEILEGLDVPVSCETR